jgi:hypothetical protein
MPWLFGFALGRIIHTTECVQLPVVRTSPASHGRPAAQTSQRSGPPGAGS